VINNVVLSAIFIYKPLKKLIKPNKPIKIDPPKLGFFGVIVLWYGFVSSMSFVPVFRRIALLGR